MRTKITLESITPARAAALLELRPDWQRTLRDQWARKMAASMSDGTFAGRVSAPIVVHVHRGTSTLIDGQHRMRAVMISGATVRMHVMRITNDSDARALAEQIDRGHARTPGDRLGFRGIGKYRGDLMALGRWVYSYRVLGQPSPCNAHRYTEQVLDYVTDHHDTLLASARFGRLLYGQIKPVLVAPPRVIAMAHLLLSAIDAETAEQYITDVFEGINLPANHPAMTVRRQLLGMRNNAGDAAVRDQLGWLLCGWSALQRGIKRFAYHADNWPQL